MSGQPPPPAAAPPPQGPQVVQPQPVPMTWQFAPQPGGLLVIAISTPTGQMVLFMQPAEAKALAAEMDKQAGLARSGLIIPNGVMPRAPEGGG